MDFNQLHQNIVRGVAIELADEFDRNFERKAFFSEAWPQTVFVNGRGSMMLRTGNLRRSIRHTISGSTISFTSSLPYASIHNEGGQVTVTEKMRRYFWAMFKQSSGQEAQQWKAMALKQVGSKINIAKRQVVGHHPEVDRIVERVINEEMEALNQHFINMLRP